MYNYLNAFFCFGIFKNKNMNDNSDYRCNCNFCKSYISSYYHNGDDKWYYVYGRFLSKSKDLIIEIKEKNEKYLLENTVLKKKNENYNEQNTILKEKNVSYKKENDELQKKVKDFEKKMQLLQREINEGLDYARQNDELQRKVEYYEKRQSELQRNLENYKQLNAPQLNEQQKKTKESLKNMKITPK